jgi:predicted alpha-1,2-mannosidase
MDHTAGSSARSFSTTQAFNSIFHSSISGGIFMSIRRTLVFTLLSCTALAGCDGSDDKPTAAGSTFGTVNTEPSVPAGASKADLAALRQENAAGLTSVTVEHRAKLDAQAGELDSLKQANASALTSLQTKFDSELDALKRDSAAALAAGSATAAALAETQKSLQTLQVRADTDHKKALALTLWKMSSLDVPAIAEKLPTAQANRATLATMQTGIDKLFVDATSLQATPGLPADTQAKLPALIEQADALTADYAAAATSDDIARVFTDTDALLKDLAAAANDPEASAELGDRVAAAPPALDRVTGELTGDITKFANRLTSLNDSLELLRPRTDLPLTLFVNAFVGTSDSDSGGGHAGNVNPGAQTPFGMVSFGPDTNGSGSAYGSGSGGYYYDDSTIQFFDLTHLNGPGCRGQGAVAMLPSDAATTSLSNGLAYSHKNETAEPGYYKVKFDNGITTEVTATTRTGMMRLTYADAAKAFLIVNTRLNNGGSKRSGGVDSSFVDIKIGSDGKSISGNSVASPFCDGTWTQPVYFHATFDKPLKSVNPLDAAGDIATLQFDVTAADPTVQFRVGISSVSTANAKLNLDTENAQLSFDEIRKQSSDTWNRRLNTIQLDLAKPGEIDKLETQKQKTAATDNLKKFYTAFYRVYSGPTVYSDVNGDYRSMKQVDLKAAGGSLPQRGTENVANYKFKVDGADAGYKTHYSGFSMWDTYRSGAQLVALVAPEEASDMMQSLVADAQQCGAFPHWVDGSEDTIPMQGDHALNVVAGSYAFGATKFDLAKARDFVRQSVFDPTSRCNDKLSVGRNSNLPGLPGYLKLGYIASDATPRWDAGSATVEMITSDRSAAAFLSRLPTAAEDKDDIEKLAARARNWTNIFDDSPAQMTLRAKNNAGAWKTAYFHEGTEPHYIWAFAHDWTALVDKLGGKAAAIARLNALFTLDNSNPFKGAEPTGPNLNSGQGGSTFYIGNEPSFQTPWAYNWAGAPKYGQYVIPLIMRKNFSLGPGGLPGNDDMGATSGWYVLAALGLYPVIPSEPGLAVSTPQFSGMTLWLGNGKKLRIASDRQAMLDDVRYISEMKLNDATYQGSWLPLEKIKEGGVLRYTLSAEPTEWGAGDALTPPSGPLADYSKATASPLARAVQLIQ